MNIFEAIQKSDIVRIPNWNSFIILKDGGFYTSNGTPYGLGKNLMNRTDWQALIAIPNEKTVEIDRVKYRIEE